jgi:hypothetical protein
MLTDQHGQQYWNGVPEPAFSARTEPNVHLFGSGAWSEQDMFRSSYQSGFLSLLASVGSKPLSIWSSEGACYRL